VLWLCRPVVNEPQVGVRCAGPCGDSVAIARMYCVWLMGVVVSAVMDEQLECLKGCLIRVEAATR
jgi:hypothetical protein